jgi:hypothetical protein
MAWMRRACLFVLGVYLLVYSLTVDAVQLGILVSALLLMGVITWDQIAASFGRNNKEENSDSGISKRRDGLG